jgi:hypothetical protein
MGHTSSFPHPRAEHSSYSIVPNSHIIALDLRTASNGALMNQYALQIPAGIERQLRRCRASLRQSIRERLQEIVEGVAARASSARRSKLLKGPPLRFYVFEGYRISYEVDPLTRSVLVLELRPASG